MKLSTVALPLGCLTNHLAEVVVAYYGLMLAKNINANLICLKGDSNNIIQCLMGKQKTLLEY